MKVQHVTIVASYSSENGYNKIRLSRRFRIFSDRQYNCSEGRTYWNIVVWLEGSK